MNANEPVVFRPPTALGLQLPQKALIAAGFFVFVQIAFLDGMAARVGFTVVFGVFLLIGGWLGVRSARRWPKEIRMSEQGISYASMETVHGVELIPWQEVERMDLFRELHLPPFLRIGLREGEFRRGLRKPGMQQFSRGLDVNIPIRVDAEPEVVLETAERFWMAQRSGVGA